MSRGQRKLAAIMFTDMIGYTTLGQRNESLSIALVDEQRKLVRPIFARHNGREVKTMGDAFLAEFPNSLDAVRCAYDIQRAIREFNFSLPEEERLHLRIGVHLGDVIESEGDISGDAVNVASRIEPLAEEGGVCVTSQVYDTIRGKFELEMNSLGQRTLKNVDLPVEVFKMIMPWQVKAQARKEEPEANRIAILPFRNMSPNADDQFFAEGITEELISTVSKINELTVISRTSVMRYRDLTTPISQIAQELKVKTVLEGSIRKGGNKVRVTAQLIDVKSDGHLWSQSYDRELNDIFAIQSDIAEQISAALKVRLASGELGRLRGKATEDIGAYTLYLKGRYFWNERTEEGNKKALKYFEQAVRIDPTFAMAYSGLSDCYNISSDYHWLPSSEALPLAKADAIKALEIDDHLAEAHASLGLAIASLNWDFSSSERELKRAIELKHNYAVAHHWYAVQLFQMRRFAEAKERDREALELDPYSRVYNMSNANILLNSTPEDAARIYDRLEEEYPDFPAMRYWRSICYVLLGQYDRALDEAKKYVELDHSTWASKLNLGWVLAMGGNRAEAERIVAEAIDARGKSFVGPTSIATVKLALGLKEEGYSWLDKAFMERDPHILYFNAFPWMKEYRKDSRWKSIEEKLGFASAPDDA